MKTLTAADIPELMARARKGAAENSKRPLIDILRDLERVGDQWRAGGSFYERALADLPAELSFSREVIAYSLSLLPEMFSLKNLTARLRADFGSLDLLDGFAERAHFAGRVRFVPHGVLLHVSAGNVFLGFVDSLLMGLVTKNFSLVKVSSNNQTFPRLLSESVKAAGSEALLSSGFEIVHWRGGDATVEASLAREIDAVIAWGGDEMIQSYRRLLPSGVPLIEHGPKISFQVVTKKAMALRSFEETGALVAKDVSAWDQAACASPQNLFIEDGIEVDALLAAIARGFETTVIPRGRIDADEAVEILKEEFRAKMTSFDGERSGRLLKGATWMIHYDPRPGIRPSPLNRTLIVKSFRGIADLEKQLEPARRVLQSCSYALAPGENGEYLNRLARFGVLRFAPLGTVMDGVVGAPHDGRFSLVELGRVAGDERTETLLDFVNEVIQKNEFYANLYGHAPVKKSGDLIFLNGLGDMPLPEKTARGGYIFSSGGTSGQAKYVYFTNEEFDRVGEMLSRSYVAQGLKPGDVCANLFVAGNMWSSFLAVEKALTYCGAVQLPIGGMAEPMLIVDYLAKFKPRALFGLPSLLIDLALKAEQNGRSGAVTIEKVFYAGEHLTQQGRAILSRVFGVSAFHSAGYASVDAGPIGYQCRFTKPREHHVFEDFVHLEIHEGEGVVTSLVRRMMPVIHLRTGDHLEWTDEGKTCDCGSRERKFILHGRVDGQMRIWSSRVLLTEVEEALRKAGIGAGVFQITLDDRDPDNGETMTVRYEPSGGAASADVSGFLPALHEAARDLKATHPPDYLRGRLLLLAVAPFSLPRVARTGKIRPVIDLRKI